MLLSSAGHKGRLPIVRIQDSCLELLISARVSPKDNQTEAVNQCGHTGHIRIRLFIVINADDYYGKEGFSVVHEYLVSGGESCMAGFVLKNTLSDNGGVTRGICKMDAQNNLTEVVETKNIVKTSEGAETEGVRLDTDSLVSMNMWGLTPGFLKVLEKGFAEFFEKEVVTNPLKAEYLIPTFIGELLEQGKMSVKVLRSNDTWYGMTYKEDVAAVKNSFKEMLEKGIYKEDLFSDL